VPDEQDTIEPEVVSQTLEIRGLPPERTHLGHVRLR
jgi:hypothetical protein